MPGHLFTQYFLTEGIKTTPEWRDAVSEKDAFRAFLNGVQQHFDYLSAMTEPNEAVTEQELIRPVLEILGWKDYLPQQGAKLNEDIPDYLLFSDADSKQKATAKSHPGDRLAHALVVEESKRFGLPLDAREAHGKGGSRTPHGQMLRYLSTAESVTDGDLHWGFLTNGTVWRLYDYRVRPRATAYFEANLGDMLRHGNEEGLRVFYLLFRRDSFVLQEGAISTFLDTALEEGRRYEGKVAQDLSAVVFERVFPKLVDALASESGEKLSNVRHAALIFLYRLLFILYAEDRGLLPVNDSRYDDYGLRKKVRDDVARRMRDSDTFSAVALQLLRPSK